LLGLTYFFSADNSGSAKLSVSDVIHRKHFGKSEDKKLLPNINQNGLQIVDNISISSKLPLLSLQNSFTTNEAVIIVDTFSTGAMLANMLYKMGVRIISVLSGDLKDLLSMVPAGMDFEFAENLVLNSQLPDPELALQNLLDEIEALPFAVVAVLAGAETGVELADQLSESLGLRSNGTAFSEARRNKFEMGEAVRAAGGSLTHFSLA
jgi:hypothetical protein